MGEDCFRGDCNQVSQEVSAAAEGLSRQGASLVVPEYIREE